MIFTRAEIDYLNREPIGRLSTIGSSGEPQIRPVGVHRGPGSTTVDVRGHALADTQKWRNAQRNPRVAFIVDTVASVDPSDARGIEIRGDAEALAGQGPIAWGLDAPGTRARDVR